MPISKNNSTGLILSGGGARGAYQAGVLRGISEIFAEQPPKLDIITGVSAGAINAAYLAAEIDTFQKCTKNLWDFWSELKPDDIFHTNFRHLTGNMFRLVKNFTVGAWRDDLNERNLGLLSPLPLNELLRARIDFSGISRNIESGMLDVLAISAFDYESRLGITYYQGANDKNSWRRSHRLSKPEIITADHIMASASIPLFFPAHKIENRHLGDGCLRNTAPLSPAIRLGANKLLIIGVRQSLKDNIDLSGSTNTPSWGQILSTVISAIFFDGLEMDLERLDRINQNIAGDSLRISEPTENENNGAHPLKKVELLYIHPSKNLADLATKHFDTLPRSLKLLFRTLGASKDSGDLISYFLFQKEYCQELLELGKADAIKRASDLKATFSP